MEVGRLSADIELLELTAEYLKDRIKDALPLINLLEEDTNYQTTPDGDAKKLEIERRKQQVDKSATKSCAGVKNTFVAKEQIAKNSYRIHFSYGMPFRTPESETAGSGDATAQVIRQLDRLEAKIDRIAKSVAGGPGR